ncbi:MAG: acyltransferase [Bacteroidales bacterium]|nr:acyltransferase [Bacteroidales bacterium]
MDQNFDELRPYYDSEMPAAIRRVAASPYLPAISAFLFPEKPEEEVRQLLLKSQNTLDFQKNIMLPAIHSIVDQTSSGLGCSGVDSLKDGTKRMFIANHRDILLDAAILQILLLDNGMDTSEITFGSNLMKGELVVDIGKMNKMFRIMRGGTVKEFYKSSMEVSSYMRYAILQKKQSVWIAQRNGRTKDGADKTDMAVLKMFALSSDKPFFENMQELHITPIVVSYEYEPCDFMKTQELFITRYQKYEKEPDEDLQSILHGIRQFKGHIHFVFTEAITDEELRYCDRFDRNRKFQQLAQIIDRRIYDNYRLWPTNYIAHDLLNQSYRYRSHYTEEQRKHFMDYMDEGLKNLIGEEAELRDIFLHIYATPVDNLLTAN